MTKLFLLRNTERRLPKDVPCIELLLHWNSTPKEGKGKAHIEVTHRLNQIGREDLAEWLSKTVFHQLSKNLKESLDPVYYQETTVRLVLCIYKLSIPETFSMSNCT